MLRKLVFLFVVISGVVSISSALKPLKEFVLCHRSDPDFGKCLSRAIPNSIRGIVSGSKELGLPVLDYMEVSRIDIKGTGGPIDMTQHYTDCVVSGPTNSTFPIVETSFEKDNCYIRMKSFTDALIVACQGVLDGKLLLFQVRSNGSGKMTHINMHAWHNATCDFYEKDGNEYLNITDWTEDYAPENVLYDIHNLVDGNAELSAHVLQVMNDNALEVYENLKSGYEKVFANIYKQLAKKVFNKIPWREIFLE